MYNITAKKNSKEYKEYIIEITKKKEKDAKNFKEKLTDKVFDIIERNNNYYFIDTDLNQIWDEDTNIVGIIKNNKNIFFEDEKKMIDNIINENNLESKIVNSIKYS